MERSIGELERAVLESSVLLEHLKLGARQKASESRRPDGTSVGRSTHCNPDHGRRGPLPITPVKLPRYSGLTPLEPYFAQVELAALHGGWSGEETATHLALALEGPALQVLADLLPEDRRKLQAITAALQWRFGQRTSVEQSREQLAGRYRHDGESLGAFAADVQLYTQRGYPTFPVASREELSLHSFLRGLAPERLCQHVRLSTPRSLEEALREAERAEEVLGAGSAPGRSPSWHRPVRAASREAAGECLEGEVTSRAQPAVTRRRPRDDRCHRCGEPGHFARDCLAASPRPRAESLTGNGYGMRHCVIAGQLCRALVDTGSTICLLRRGVLPGTAGPLPTDWTPTTTELLTVTGEKTVMPGKKLLPVVVGAQQISHEFWLADIRDDCIVGLDLLARWGACVDVPGSAICLGAETIPLRSGRSAAGESQRRRGSCTTRASAPQPPHRDHRSPAQAGQERQRRRRGSRTTRASAPQPPHQDHRSPAQAGQEGQRRGRGSCTTRASAPQQPHRDHRSPAQAGQERQRRRSHLGTLELEWYSLKGGRQENEWWPTTAACRYCRRHEERELGPSAAAVTTGEGEPFSREQLQQHQEMDPVLAEVRSWLETQQRPQWPAISARGPEIKLLHSQWGSDSVSTGQAAVRRRSFTSTAVMTVQLKKDPPNTPQGLCSSTWSMRLWRGSAWISWALFPLPRLAIATSWSQWTTSPSGLRHIQFRTRLPPQLPSDWWRTCSPGLGYRRNCTATRGKNFESRLFAEVCQRLGVRKTRTTPLHPQSDGLVERFNRTLATQLAILTSRHQKDWDQHLPLVPWAYRTAVQESSQCTPATLMFGRELRTPVDLVFGPPPEPEITGGPELDYLRRLKERLSVVHQLARESQGDAGARQKRAYDGRCHGHPFSVGDNVWVYCPVRKRGLSPKLTSHWQGPGEILDRISEVVYRVRMPGRGRRVVLHRDRLAPYHPLAPNPVTEPEDSLLSATPSASMNNGGLGAEPGTVSGPLQRPAHARRLPGQLRDFVVGLID
ncbi:hypothetical protein Q8A73_001823 [Channa argus]|nr:hypothetical protein Q8A73_001823 [Channa argus]